LLGWILLGGTCAAPSRSKRELPFASTGPSPVFSGDGWRRHRHTPFAGYPLIDWGRASGGDALFLGPHRSALFLFVGVAERFQAPLINFVFVDAGVLVRKGKVEGVVKRDFIRGSEEGGLGGR